jgi:hypothetical protein
MPNSGMNQCGPSNDNYETPAWLFRALDTEFGFTFDGAASAENRLVNGNNWTNNLAATLPIDPAHRIYCNPPYSEIGMFVQLLLKQPNFSVLLLPSRTGTDWFQMLCESPRVEIRFLRKRIKFCLDGKEEASPRFDSIIAIVRPT